MIKTPLRLLALGLVVCSPSVRAEVAVDLVGDRANTLVVGVITDDPVPIGIWLPYRPLPPNRMLNADGDARGDGRPDLDWKSNSWPVAVWAYNAGGDFDIAFSEWDGTQWTATSFLTASTDDERDPRLLIEADGTLHVVWWTASPVEKVYLATRPSGSSTWYTPALVTTGAETGRRPSVVVFDGELTVAYERDSPSGAEQEVRVATLQPGGGFAFETAGATARAEPLDVMLHTGQGHLWADWKHEAGEFGFAEHQASGGWSGNDPEPWIDPSWIGVEETRRAIRDRVLE